MVTAISYVEYTTASEPRSLWSRHEFYNTRRKRNASNPNPTEGEVAEHLPSCWVSKARDKHSKMNLLSRTRIAPYCSMAFLSQNRWLIMHCLSSEFFPSRHGAELGRSPNGVVTGDLRGMARGGVRRWRAGKRRVPERCEAITRSFNGLCQALWFNRIPRYNEGLRGGSGQILSTLSRTRESMIRYPAHCVFLDKADIRIA